MAKEPQTPKKDAPKKEQTPPGTGSEGEALTPEEKIELEQLREIKKTTGFTKFAESAKEAQRLLERNKVLEGKLEESNETPSEEELKKKYPDFDDMDPEEKSKAIADMKKDKRLKTLEAKEKMREDYNSLPQDVKEKIEKKEGGYGSFRDFACSPDNAGQKDLLNLAKSYLYDETLEVPAKTEDTPPAPGLEDGGGGKETTPPPEEGYTTEEIKEMRTKNPEKYRRLAKEKKLKIKG